MSMMERQPKSYTGITGFTEAPQVTSCLENFPADSNRLLMVGALVTYKTLRNLPINPNRQGRMAKPEQLSELFLDDDRTLNLVHYSTEEGKERLIISDLLRIYELAGPNFNGFQLNMSWPDVEMIDQYRLLVEGSPIVVLQIGNKAMGEIDNSPQNLVERLHPYTGVIDYILLDPSGGSGKPFDPEVARAYLRVIAEKDWGIGLGVAGGLGPNSFDHLLPLIEEFPKINIDVEGKVTDQGKLYLPHCREYLTQAYEISKLTSAN